MKVSIQLTCMRKILLVSYPLHHVSHKNKWSKNQISASIFAVYQWASCEAEGVGLSGLVGPSEGAKSPTSPRVARCLPRGLPPPGLTQPGCPTFHLGRVFDYILMKLCDANSIASGSTKCYFLCVKLQTEEREKKKKRESTYLPRST